MIDMTRVVIAVMELVFTLIGSIAAAVVLPKLSAYLKGKVDAQTRSKVWAVLDSLVMAAQQLYNKNEDKLDYVQNQLAERNIAVNRSDIEASVYRMKQNSMAALRQAILDEPEEVTEEGK